MFPQSVIQLDIHLQKTGLCERNFCEVKCIDGFEMKGSRGSRTQSDKVPQGKSLETNIRLHRRQKTEDSSEDDENLLVKCEEEEDRSLTLCFRL